MKYDISTPDITYNDSNGYRDAIRIIFKMNEMTENTLLKKDDVDEESWDEMLFDSISISKTMDEIYEKTKDNPLFAELYEIAAAQMISTDSTIGHAVLMSYHYFYLYHPCVCIFMQSPDSFNETCYYYVQLKNALTKY
jgi:hypothetical protein